MSDTALQIFDYDHDGQRAVVEQKFSEAQTHLRQGLASLIEAGIRYRDIRDWLKNNQRGGFEGWLNWKGLAKGTIYRLIGLAETFGGLPDMARLDMSAGAAYLLSGPTVPEATRQTAIDQARAARVTVGDARQIIAENRPRPADPAQVERQTYLWSSVNYLDETVRLAVLRQIANESQRGPELLKAAQTWPQMPPNTARADIRAAATRLIAAAEREHAAPEAPAAAPAWTPPARPAPSPEPPDLTPAVLAWLDDQVANADLADDDDGRRAVLRGMLNDRWGVGARAWASLNRRLGRAEPEFVLASIRGALAQLLARDRPTAGPDPHDLVAGLEDLVDRLVAYAARRPDPELDGLIAAAQRLAGLAEELAA